jgi:hypothetical protein
MHALKNLLHFLHVLKTIKPYWQLAMSKIVVSLKRTVRDGLTATSWVLGTRVL